MTSTHTMIVLCVFYAVIMVQAVGERNWPRALYFFAAILISLAVMWMPAYEQGAPNG